MRLLQVAHSGLPGGSNEVLLSLIRHRPSGGSTACVFLEDGPAVQRAAALGAPTAVVEAGRARELWRASPAIRHLRGAIRAAAADAVLAHVSKAHLYAAPAAWLEGVPCLWFHHERWTDRPGMLRAACRLPAAAAICPSDFAAAELRTRAPRLTVRRVHPGRDATGAPAMREHAGGPAVIGVVGRLQRWKRVELVLHALAAVLDVAPGTRLRVIGDAWPGLDEDYPSWLSREAEALGVAGAVEFAGHVPDAAAAIASLDVLVHAAEDEPFGLVLVEAMLAGVPVVAPRRGGPAEIVRDGIDGRLVEAERPGALAAAVAELVRDPRLRARMGAAGRERAEREFTAERMAAEVWAICDAMR